jgi:hypothetical protein
MHGFYQISSKKRASPKWSTETSFALAGGRDDDHEENDVNDSDSYSVADMIEKVSDNTVLVLQAIQDWKLLVKYVKRVMHFFSLDSLLMSLL